MSTGISEFLTGARTLAAKFPNIGDNVGGPITEEPQMRQQTDFATREPLFWPDGEKKMQVVVTVQTDRRDDENDDGRRRIFVKGQMKDAVSCALRAARVKEPAVGGILTVTYVRDGERTDGGFGALPKVYEASYVPPDASADEEAPQDASANEEAIANAELSESGDDEPPF
jgi:hypothetical protein